MYTFDFSKAGAKVLLFFEIRKFFAFFLHFFVYMLYFLYLCAAFFVRICVQRTYIHDKIYRI